MAILEAVRYFTTVKLQYRLWSHHLRITAANVKLSACQPFWYV